MSLLNKVYSLLPNWFQSLMVYAYNKKAYASRYGGDYWKYRDEKKRNRSLTVEELTEYQRVRYKHLVDFVTKNSEFYKESFAVIEKPNDIANIRLLPIVNKEILRNNINRIIVKNARNLQSSKTGGTTGKSLEVKNFARNNQERFAFLDDFRSRFGYELGKRTAWFSGKNLLTQRDIKKNRFWKTDPFHKVRYYSTFHIKEDYLKFYVEDLIKFCPEYLVGFPSTMYEIAKYGLRNGYSFPKNIIKAVFPTAETITEEMRS